jgi:hypothetical protein
MNPVVSTGELYSQENTNLVVGGIVLLKKKKGLFKAHSLYFLKKSLFYRTFIKQGLTFTIEKDGEPRPYTLTINKHLI